MKSWVLPSRSCSFVALARRKKDESVFSSIKQVSGLRMIMMCEFTPPKKPPVSCHVDVESVGFTLLQQMLVETCRGVERTTQHTMPTSMKIKLDKIVEINTK